MEPALRTSRSKARLCGGRGLARTAQLRTWLFWPKSKCFDYLYQDAEQLLRNYPVQATICPYGDSSSDEESGDEQDEDEEEEEEMAKMGLN
ncbi:hypothetical protein NQD34_017604 [Periophthalmus magnuspinnatus]|nr:hypothetical protein NQD34_017604 [Periophthalmus magnuspinnatus]